MTQVDKTIYATPEARTTPTIPKEKGSLAGRSVSAGPTTVPVATPVPPLAKSTNIEPSKISADRVSVRNSVDAKKFFAWVAVAFATIFSCGLVLVAHDKMCKWANGR